MQLRTALSFNQYVTFPWKSLEQRFFEYLSQYEKELTRCFSNILKYAEKKMLRNFGTKWVTQIPMH